jgi:hypothetical protein
MCAIGSVPRGPSRKMQKAIMRKPRFYFATAYIIAALLALASGAQAQAADRNIVGTWVVTVTVNTPPGAPPFVFTDLIAFNSGGTLTAASSTFNAHTSENPHLPPPLVADTSDGYGAWKPVGDDANQFALTFKRFLFAGANTSTALYGPFFPGQNIGVNTVQAVGTLHTGIGGDTLSGSFTNQFVNLDGTVVVFSGSGTFSATRLGIEPLAGDG